jgi:hypothetical protein
MSALPLPCRSFVCFFFDGRHFGNEVCRRLGAARRPIIRTNGRPAFHELPREMGASGVVREFPHELDDFNGEYFRSILEFLWGRRDFLIAAVKKTQILPRTISEKAHNLP